MELGLWDHAELSHAGAYACAGFRRTSSHTRLRGAMLSMCTNLQIRSFRSPLMRTSARSLVLLECHGHAEQLATAEVRSVDWRRRCKGDVVRQQLGDGCQGPVLTVLPGEAPPLPSSTHTAFRSYTLAAFAHAVGAYSVMAQHALLDSAHVIDAGRRRAWPQVAGDRRFGGTCQCSATPSPSCSRRTHGWRVLCPCCQASSRRFVPHYSGRSGPLRWSSFPPSPPPRATPP